MQSACTVGKLAVIVATSSPEEAVLGGGMGMATFGIRRGIGYFLERRFWPACQFPVADEFAQVLRIQLSRAASDDCN